MNIGVDIDGVLFPWAEVANEACVEKFGIDDPGEHLRWGHIKPFLTPEQWRWLWSKQGQDRVFGQIDHTYPGAVEAVLELMRAKHRVHFVTHRDPRRTAVHTARFLDLHFGRYQWEGLHIVRSGVATNDHRVGKADIMTWDAFIEDKTETVDDLIERTDALVFAPARPWNSDLDQRHKKTGRLVIYNDPMTIVKALS
jgi:hypothetical protein